MRQCSLRHAKDSRECVAWIPTEHAVLGKLIDLKRDTHSWDCGWIVAEVYPLVLLTDYVRDHERDYKSQREASDI